MLRDGTLSNYHRDQITLTIKLKWVDHTTRTHDPSPHDPSLSNSKWLSGEMGGKGGRIEEGE